MKLDQLEALWASYDQELDTHVEMNESRLKTVSIDKVRSLLTTMRLSALFEWAAYILFLMVLIPFAIRYFGEMRFFLPAFGLIAYSIMDLLLNARQLYLSSSLDYAGPITDIQKQVSRLYKQSKWDDWSLLIRIPVFGILLLIVAAKGLLGMDLYQVPNALLYAGIGCAVVAPLVVLFVRLFPDEGLERARAFLKEIAQFEEEGEAA